MAVGSDVAIPADAERIDVRGLHVYPGLFDALHAAGPGRNPVGPRHGRHAGNRPDQPQCARPLAVNPDSELIPVTRRNGVLTVLTAPGGTLVAGTSSLMMLDGWTTEDMLLKPAVAMHVTWPKIAADPHLAAGR